MTWYKYTNDYRKQTSGMVPKQLAISLETAETQKIYHLN